MIFAIFFIIVVVPLSVQGIIPDKWPTWARMTLTMIAIVGETVVIYLFAHLVWAIVAFVLSTALVASFQYLITKGNIYKPYSKKNQKWLAEAATHGPLWQWEVLDRTVRETYARYTADLQSANVASMQTYMAPEMVERTKALITAMRQTGHHTVFTTQQIKTTFPENQHDGDFEGPIYNTWEKVAMAIWVQADITVIQDATGEQLSHESTDLWFTLLFEQQGNAWVLLDLVPGFSIEPGYDIERDWAKQLGMHFLDKVTMYVWPKTWQIFSNPSSGVEVYECYAGWQNNRLLQMYWVTGTEEIKSREFEYFVGEVQIPRSYEGVIISPKKLQLTPAGYQRVEVEWAEFNQRYDMYARSGLAADVFEVLEPDVMTLLYDTVPDASIEIVGNILYVYYEGLLQSFSIEGYARMLKVLNALATKI